jgi:hypothetical protein
VDAEEVIKNAYQFHLAPEVSNKRSCVSYQKMVHTGCQKLIQQPTNVGIENPA